MSLPYQTLARMTNDYKEKIRKEVKQFLNSLVTDYDEKNQNES